MLHIKDPGARQSTSKHLSSGEGQDLSFPSDTEFSTVDNPPVGTGAHKQQ